MILALLSATATVVAVLAPLLLRAVDESTLQSAVARAGSVGTAITATADVRPGHGDGAVAAARRVALAAGDAGRYADPVVSIESTSTVTWPSRGGILQRSLLVAPVAGCIGVRIVAGSCGTSDSDVLIPSSAHAGLALGATVDISAATGGATGALLHVTGVYDPTRSSGITATSPNSEVGGIEALSADDLVVRPTELTALHLDGTASAVRRLRGTIGLDDVQPITNDIHRARQATLSEKNAVYATAVDTDADAVLATALRQQRAAAVVMIVVIVDAVALAWFAEALVIQRVGRDRAREWGVGRLRGMRRPPWLARIFVEPAVALVAGTAVGLALAAPLAAAIVAVALHPSVAVEVAQPAVPAAAGLVLLGSIVALGAASVRSARLPLAALLRETTEPRRISRVGVAAQSAVLVVTALVLYALETGRTISGPQIAVLAPGLVAVLFAVIAMRAAIAAMRLASRRPPRSLAGLIVGRRLSRAPSSLSTAVVIVVGVALAVYTVDLAAVSTRFEAQRAATAVGAATVLRVTTPQALPLITAVDRADPSGHSAMAAEELTPVNETGTSRVLALDTTRLGPVTSAVGSISGTTAAALRRTLRPSVGPTLELRGSALRIRLGGADVTTTVDTLAVIHLEVTVQNASGWHTVDLGTVKNGTIRAPIPCTAGCRLVWIGTRDLVKASSGYEARMTVQGLATDTQSAADLAAWLDPARWRNRIGDQQNPERPAEATLSRGSDGGLGVDFSDFIGSETTSISTLDAPEPLPAEIAAGTSPTQYPGIHGSAIGVGLDSLPRVLHIVGTEPVLPRLSNDGVLVDLGMMSLVDDPTASQAVKEVWLAPGAHPKIVAALAAEGVRVVGTQTLAAAARADRAEAVPSTALLSGAVGLAALLLAGLALVASRVVGVGDRRRDWASLEDAGVSRMRLRRLLIAEILLPNALGALVGGAAGIVAFAITAPHLPLLAGVNGAPPLDAHPPLLAIGFVLAGVIATIVCTAILAARAELRATHGNRA